MHRPGAFYSKDIYEQKKFIEQWNRMIKLVLTSARLTYVRIHIENLSCVTYFFEGLTLISKAS